VRLQRPPQTMNLSGIVVTVLPPHVATVVARLAALAATEVMHVDAASGRIVIVQERATIGEEFDGLRAIQRLPHVLSADLVMHYFGEDAQPLALAAEQIARRLDTPPPTPSLSTNSSVPSPS
jgi:nitrate reductase NapAB chaperone NapD